MKTGAEEEHVDVLFHQEGWWRGAPRSGAVARGRCLISETLDLLYLRMGAPESDWRPLA